MRIIITSRRVGRIPNLREPKCLIKISTAQDETIHFKMLGPQLNPLSFQEEKAKSSQARTSGD